MRRANAPLNENLGNSDQEGSGEDAMRRFAVFAIAGWLLAFILLRGYLALPDLPGWFVAVGLLGAIPGFVCSWLTITLNKPAGLTAHEARYL